MRVVWLMALLIFMSCAASVADAKKSPKKKKKKARDVDEVVTTGPVSIKLRAFDRVRLKALVEIGGLKKAPKSNLFKFTDERKRHYVAMDCKCETPLPSGTLVCELGIPPGYERHKLVSLELHTRSLQSATVKAPDAQVEAAWAAAEAQELPKHPTRPKPTPPKDGVDDEEESNDEGSGASDEE